MIDRKGLHWLDHTCQAAPNGGSARPGWIGPGSRSVVRARNTWPAAMLPHRAFMTRLSITGPVRTLMPIICRWTTKDNADAYEERGSVKLTV
jgi:hypothetical protein